MTKREEWLTWLWAPLHAHLAGQKNLSARHSSDAVITSLTDVRARFIKLCRNESNNQFFFFFF